MDVFREVGQIPEDFGPTAVTLGNFDGVHLGHREVLQALVGAARARGLRSLAMTFDPHPRAVHRPDCAPAEITPTVLKLERMAQTGIDAALVQTYTLDFARQTPEEFVVGFLIGRLGARFITVGRDVRFGTDNTGDLETLMELGAQHGLEVEVTEEVGNGARYSSTAVRAALESGDVATAAQMLGAHHEVRGEVVHGDARGREMGFPTANLAQDALGAVPADGIYAGLARFEGLDEVYPAAISIGTNPTFDGHERRVEAHLIDVEFDGFDVYGRTMTLAFVDRIRGQVEFTGMEALIEQMRDDVERIRDILAE